MRIAPIVVLLLFICGVSAWADEPMRNPHNSSEEKQTVPIQSKQITDAEMNLKPSNRLHPAQDDNNNAVKQQKSEENKTPNDKLIAWSTVILALVTTALAVFTALLWKATNKLVESAKDTAVRQLRAYINISQGIVLNFDDPLNRIFRLDIKNLGQTPAYEVSTVFKCIVREFPLDKNKPLEKVSPEDHKIFSVMGPNCEYRRDMTVPYNGEWVEPKIKDGSTAIYGYGEIRYSDTFGIHRVTEFRYMCKGDGISIGGVAPCEEGNYST